MAHSALESQVESMTEVWGWSENDRILHVLPMHHIHGVRPSPQKTTVIPPFHLVLPHQILFNSAFPVRATADPSFFLGLLSQTVNVLLTSLWNGATCEFMPKFDAEAVRPSTHFRSDL
jgi:acyl-CoA synthetase (AMP-forming)/AMP-acid ligase II